MLYNQSLYACYKGHLEAKYLHVSSQYNKVSKKSHFLIKKEDGSLFMRKCNTCEKWKYPHEMKVDKKRQYGVSTYCKECNAKSKKRYEEENREKVRESEKRYREANKEYILKRGKEWRENNPDYIRKRYEEKGEYIRQIVREYYRKNKEQISEQARIRHLFRKRAEYEVSGGEALETFYEKFGMVCGLTGNPLKITHIEHLLPIHKGGGNLWSNLYPAEASLNVSKRDRNVFEWIKRRNDIDFTFFFKYTLPYLAEHKGLTVDEFTVWYNSTYENHIGQISSQQNTPSNTEELPIQEAFLF